MKYVSGDLETTGLIPNTHRIIEFAFVIDDLAHQRPVETLPAIHGFVRNSDNMFWGNGALEMFAPRIAEYNAAPKIDAADVVKTILNFLPAFLIMDFAKRSQTQGFDSYKVLTEQKVTFAGKNFASFDRPFLQWLPEGERLSNIMHHRFIDPGSMYLEPKDVTVPSTSECLKRANIGGKVSHRALDDARDVVRLIRHKFGSPK